MPWPIHYHETAPEKPQPGDMWPWSAALLPGRGASLSEEYRTTHEARRPPLVVRLPGGAGNFCIDANYDGETWTVTGEPPTITVNPSIHAPGIYHGWLQNGVLSDDSEGRSFP